MKCPLAICAIIISLSVHTFLFLLLLLRRFPVDDPNAAVLLFPFGVAFLFCFRRLVFFFRRRGAVPCLLRADAVCKTQKHLVYQPDKPTTLQFYSNEAA